MKIGDRVLLTVDFNEVRSGRITHIVDPSGIVTIELDGGKQAAHIERAPAEAQAGAAAAIGKWQPARR